MRASRCVKQIWSETLVQTTSTLYAVLSSESSSVSCGVARWARACESDRSSTACVSAYSRTWSLRESAIIISHVMGRSGL